MAEESQVDVFSNL